MFLLLKRIRNVKAMKRERNGGRRQNEHLEHVRQITSNRRNRIVDKRKTVEEKLYLLGIIHYPRRYLHYIDL